MAAPAARRRYNGAGERWTYVSEPDLAERSVFWSHWNAFHRVQRRVRPIDDLGVPVILRPLAYDILGIAYLAKYCVLPIEMGLLGIRYEEL